MVRSGSPEPAGGDQTGSQSLGDLVAVAAKDVSQLVRYEIDLAKTELRGDIRRLGLAAALGGVAAFVGCLVLVLCCIALAYGLVALGIWTWLAFLIVAAACILLAVVAVGIAYLKVRRLSGLSKTRQSVTEGLGMLRRDGKAREGREGREEKGHKGHQVPDGHEKQVGSGSADEVAADGQRPEIAGHKPR
jgi:membrane protein implicated in regulation of membrane protease activity